MRLSTVSFAANPGNGDRGSIVNYYSSTYGVGTSGSDNNGNLTRQESYIPGVSYYQQDYTYDPLNRLKSVTERLNGGGDSFNQTFDYDRYGNRTINAAATFNAPEPQFDTNQMAAANRLYSPGENIYGACASPTTTTRLMCYDQAGNLIRDKYVTNAAWMTYDGDGKMSRHNVNDAQDDTIIYTYDADGKRKSAYIGTTTTYYIHGLGGELLYEVAGKAFTEYGYRNGELLVTAKSASRTTDTRWLVTDHLGTPRIVADQTGALSSVKRHDYLPFGEEIGSTVGGRNTTQGYAAPQSDGLRQQFTGYERDSATGLDYAQARYYGYNHGRFTSPDPYNIVLESQVENNADDARAKLNNYLSKPQQWNRYAYVVNNPLNYSDPTGEILELTGSQADKDRAFERIKQLLGEKASKNLYIEIKDGRTLVGYFDQRGGLAAGGGNVGVVLEDIINSTTTAEFSVSYEDKVTFADGTTDSIRANGGGITRILSKDRIQIFVGGFAGDIATKEAKSRGITGDDGNPLVSTNATADAHEFGHAWGGIKDNFSERYNKLSFYQYSARTELINQNKNKSVMVENWQRERLGLAKRLNH